METTAPFTKHRIYSIDILRGIIMIIMALDHVRDYYTNVPYDALDLTKTSPILFFTRWITHFCAPTFVFLSGVSVWLSSRKRTTKETAIFLLKRGLWLIILELTVIDFGWMLDPGFHFIMLQVIWAIGWSMIFLAALIALRLRPVYIGLIGLVVVFGHNLLDHVDAKSLGNYKILWDLLHQQDFVQEGKRELILVLYPLVPWIGVMAAGYWFGTLFNLPAEQRKPLFIKIGVACLLLFVLLRGFNIYGDPFPRQPQPVWWKTALEFIKCQKYPPSLLYLLMTLGISIIALALFEGVNNKVSRFFTVYGKVPFFYYLLHIYIIHVSQVIVAFSLGFTSQDLQNAFQGNPGRWGFDLWVIYAIWAAVVLLLYYPCRWFMKVKHVRTNWWLSYI